MCFHICLPDISIRFVVSPDTKILLSNQSRDLRLLVVELTGVKFRMEFGIYAKFEFIIKGIYYVPTIIKILVFMCENDSQSLSKTYSAKLVEIILLGSPFYIFLVSCAPKTVKIKPALFFGFAALGIIALTILSIRIFQPKISEPEIEDVLGFRMRKKMLLRQIRPGRHLVSNSN